MKLRYLLLATALTVMTFVGCKDLPGGQQVIVAQPDLQENTLIAGPGVAEPQAVPIVIDKVTTPKIKDALEKAFPGQSVVYITTIDHVKPQVRPVDDPTTPEIDESKLIQKTPVIIPLTPPVNKTTGEVDFGTWAGQALPAIGSLLPVGAAPWLPLVGYGLGLLFNKRSRSLLLDTAAQLNPLDEGYVDIGAAKSSLAQAIGWSHSTLPEHQALVPEKKA